MSRPRWHDAVLVSAIVGLLALGVWSLWGDDVRSALRLSPPLPNAPPVAAGST